MPFQPPRFGARPRAPRKPWERQPGQPDRRIRGRAGMKMRAQVLHEEPFCRTCLRDGRGEVGSERVDHIVPLSEGGSNGRSNLQGLCEPCHDVKSAAERAAARRR